MTDQVTDRADDPVDAAGDPETAERHQDDTVSPTATPEPASPADTAAPDADPATTDGTEAKVDAAGAAAPPDTDSASATPETDTVTATSGTDTATTPPDADVDATAKPPARDAARETDRDADRDADRDTDRETARDAEARSADGDGVAPGAGRDVRSREGESPDGGVDGMRAEGRSAVPETEGAADVPLAKERVGGAVLPADAGVPRPLVGPDGRDPHLDNVKFAAIVLVVAGHAWGPMLAWSHALQGVYLFLYTVHMPAFVIMSGYFSRHFAASPRQARGLVRAVVVPYLLVETAFTLFRYFAGGQQLDFALQDPWWVTWFLMTLFFWRLTAPLWRVVRFPLVISVVVMLAAGSQELTGTFELGRLLQYLPFFVLGLSLRQEHFAKLRSTWARVTAVPVLAGALYLAYVLAPYASVEWVYWRRSFEQLDVSYPVFAGIKLAQLAVTVLVVAAVIALVPARRIPVVTSFGAASMYAYLLHGFVTKGVEWFDVFDLPILHSHLGIAIVGVASVVLTLVLCSPPVRVLFSWAIQPRLEGWLRGNHAATK